MKIIKDKRFGEERALYMTRNARIENCRFEGEEDGESFLKESADIEVKDCFMDLRYPFWHCRNVVMNGCEMTERCRAALWYDDGVKIQNSILNGVKAFRECKHIELLNVKANSPEFGWRCKGIKIKGGSLVSEYAFSTSGEIEIENLEFTGKYSFQYTKNLKITGSKLKTKDAFWHAKNAEVRDSVIEGEYLGWYSDGLTLINCHIKGTQPLCYCKNLKLINCTTEDCDLAFEYSDVEAEIKGNIVSVKNPRSGRIEADSIGEVILGHSKYPPKAQIIAHKTK